MKHPAVYNDKFIPVFAELLKGKKKVLDPFAGTGKLALIKEHGFKGKVFCNELEQEYSTLKNYSVDQWSFGDAANMTFKDKYFDAICTSPTYGNRMADHHNAKDGSTRISYKHCLGRDLDDRNTGMMQWGQEYKNKHVASYCECCRVLAVGGVFILNVSNHIRRGEVIDVIGWHKYTLELMLKFTEELKIKTPRMKYGANQEKRIITESILVFKK